MLTIAYDTRVIVSGRVIEIIDYERPIFKELQRKEGSNLGRSVVADKQDQERHREDTLQKAKARCRRLINANAHQYHDSSGRTYKPVFFTATYADNITDLTETNKDLRRFIKRLGNRAHGSTGSLKYVAIPEFQERGAVHYHIVIFNMPWIEHKELARIWGHGFVWIKGIEQIDNVGAYVTEYMTKEHDDGRLKGRRCYMTAQGLLEPKEVKYREGTIKAKEIAEMTAQLSPKYEVTHISEHYGSITYKQYIMSRLGNQEI